MGKEPTQEQKDIYATALEWLYNSINAVKAGTTTREIALKWPSAKEAWGYAEEDQAAANLWGHGLGLAQYDPPVISRIWSLDHPIEIKPGMVFALETYCAASDGRSAARIEEEVVVTATGCDVITRFPAEELLVAGRTYVRGADLIAQGHGIPDAGIGDGEPGLAAAVASAAVVGPAVTR